MGFKVRIYLPPREHEPPHVHVVKARGEKVINLGGEHDPPEVREVYGMKDGDVLRAFRIIERIRFDLLARWRELYG